MQPVLLTGDCLEVMKTMTENSVDSIVTDPPYGLEYNNHPTVKPTALMRYLCRLVTPPNGIVFDPFMGSGSTGKAVMI